MTRAGLNDWSAKVFVIFEREAGGHSCEGRNPGYRNLFWIPGRVGMAREIKRPAPHYTAEAMKRLRKYHWPGNVRELKNFVKRMIILRPSERITDTDIEKALNPFQHETDRSVTTLANAERRHVEKALIKYRGVIGGPDRVAHLLGMPRSTLQYRLKKLGLSPQEYCQMGKGFDKMTD